MYTQTDAQSVLRCAWCFKPFDKESTLKRHGYYCRSTCSRTSGGTSSRNTPRTRSCVSCVKAKARCDHGQDGCGRCLRKGVGCEYPGLGSGIGARGGMREAREARSKDQAGDGNADVSALQRQEVGSSRPVSDLRGVENGFDGGHAADVLRDPVLDMDMGTSDHGFADLGGKFNFEGDLDFEDFLYPHPPTPTPTTFEKDVHLQPWLFSSPTDPSIPPTIQTSTVRSFPQRTVTTLPQPGAQRITSLILHTLKSYPLMMLRHKTLPPFIHPYLLSSDLDNAADMEPLTNCISLVYMLSSRFQRGRKLFWKNVRMECERLRAEHLKLNQWELLAAMQALSVYILVRVDEGETDHNNVDSLLVKTVIVVAAQFNNFDIDITVNTSNVMNSGLHSESLETSWKDWILEESARRLCVVYQVVNLLVYFEPAAMCDFHQTDMLIAPLPSKKQLWEAPDALSWKEAVATGDGREEGWRNAPGQLEMAMGLAADGNLVWLDEGRTYCADERLRRSQELYEVPSQRKSASWDEWCAGMDGFGGLVLLVASLATYL